jgi:hypothetical protein
VTYIRNGKIVPPDDPSIPPMIRPGLAPLPADVVQPPIEISKLVRIIEDPTIPENEIRVTDGKRVVRLTNLGE